MIRLAYKDKFIYIQDRFDPAIIKLEIEFDREIYQDDLELELIQINDEIMQVLEIQILDLKRAKLTARRFKISELSLN